MILERAAPPIATGRVLRRLAVTTGDTEGCR